MKTTPLDKRTTPKHQSDDPVVVDGAAIRASRIPHPLRRFMQAPPAAHGWRRIVTNRRIAFVVLALFATLMASIAAWRLDIWRTNDQVRSDVVLAGTPVGGMTEDNLRPLVAALAQQYQIGQIFIEAPDSNFSAVGSEFGVLVDEDATVRMVMDIGRDGNLFGQFTSWVGSLRGETVVGLNATLDQARVASIVAERDSGPQTAASEPYVTGSDTGELTLVRAATGEGLDAREIVERFPDASVRGFPARIGLSRKTITPTFSDSDAEELRIELLALTQQPIAVGAGTVVASVESPTLRSMVRSGPGDGEIAWWFDPQTTSAALAAALGPANVAPVEATFGIGESGAVVIRGGTSGVACCDAASVEALNGAIVYRAEPAEQPPVVGPNGWTGQGPFPLGMTTIEPNLTLAQAQAFGIVQPIGTFTTRHPSGAPRVKNIHLIADRTRGIVIQPGGTFSVNTLIGERTTETGFVPAPSIQDGIFADSVGGGISQYATTLFNASFFGGLDLVEYQSHTIYISRYPYGREATLNFPKPDLIIRNPSQYGVLIWPTYTESSITVTLYSTKWADVVQSGQTTGTRGSCTTVRTERTMTFLDGRVEKDYVSALYRAGEGLGCSDYPTTVPATTTPATTVPVTPVPTG